MSNIPQRLVHVVLFICGLILVYYYYIHQKYSLNFPYFDEYRTICKVILDYKSALNWQEKLKVLLVNENESLQLFLKVFNIGFWKIFGEIRYDLLALIGRISLLSFPIIFVLIFKGQPTKQFFSVVIVILVIFSLQYYVLSFRHDTSLYYQLGLAGVLFSIYFWQKNQYIYAILFFILGIFNNAASILIIPILLAEYFIYSKHFNKKVILIIVLLFAAIITVFYIANPYIFYLSKPPLIILKTYLIINGNYLEIINQTAHTPLYLAGVIHLLFFAITHYFIRSKKTGTAINFLRVFSWFIFISIAAISVKRSELFDHSYLLLDPRYKFFTFLSFMTLVLIWIEISSKRKIIFTISAFIFGLVNIYYAFQIQDYLRFLHQGAKVNSIAVDMGYDVMGQTHINYATKIYADLKKQNLQPKQDKELLDFYNYLKNYNLESSDTQKIEFDIETTRKMELERYHTVKRIIGKSDTKNSYIFLKSENDTYLFPINFYLRNSKAGFLKTFNFQGSYFYIYLYLSVLNQGKYSLGLIEKNAKAYDVKIYKEPIIIDKKTTDFYNF